MMRKFLPIIIVVILLLVGGAGYFLSQSKTATQQTSSPTAQGKTENKTIFSSIQEALSKSLSLQCNFTDEDGRTTNAYIKAGAIRADIGGKSPEESGSMIMKDKKIYFWNPTTKQGFMTTITDEQLKDVQNQMTQPNGAKEPSNNQGQNMMSMIEKFKDHCKAATVSDTLFVIPTDVKFQDMSALINNAMKKVTGVPSINPQIMQKYAITPPPGSDNDNDNEDR